MIDVKNGTDRGHGKIRISLNNSELNINQWFSMATVDQIVQKICEHSKTPGDTVRKMIEEKVIELSGLVSKEGAAYIVAREMGINLLKESRRQLKVSNIVSGLRSVDIVARVVRVFDVREFEKNGKKGKVRNLILGDDTGTIRMSLWNNETERAEGIKEGDVLKISGGYVKPTNTDTVELRIGRGQMEKTDQVVPDVPVQKDIEQRFESMKRRDIADFSPGEYSETRACIVQVFRKNPFFEVCPECGTRVKQTEEKWVCDDHGTVDPGYAMVVSGVIDDGTGNIRAVFFREMAEKMFGKSTEELVGMTKKDNDSLKLFDSVGSMGKDFILRGRVKSNDFTQRNEFIVNDMEDINVKKECDILLDQA